MADCIIVGAGITGSVVGRQLAEAGKKVIILEQRNHIGGNCFDEKDEHGILIHTYGPHIFHTNRKNVFDYLSRFTKWYRFDHKVVANVHGKLIPIPFNMNTLHQVYEEKKANELEVKLKAKYPEGARVPILELMSSEEEDIRNLAKYVYDNVFVYYTMKQWGKKPEEIDPAVTGRVPVLISYDNRYFQEEYQGVPLDGFTPMFEAMLSHENIQVELNTKAEDVLRFAENEVFYKGEKFDGPVIYTGPIDELFWYKYGRLPYRSLRFLFENYKQDDYQGHSVVNYTVDEDFTRITEFKHLTGQKADTTTIVKEYPIPYTGENGENPYYVIENPENRALYEKYLDEAKKFSNLYLLGRLAEYKYYNIDAMVEKALQMAETIL